MPIRRKTKKKSFFAKKKEEFARIDRENREANERQLIQIKAQVKKSKIPPGQRKIITDLVNKTLKSKRSEFHKGDVLTVLHLFLMSPYAEGQLIKGINKKGEKVVIKDAKELKNTCYAYADQELP